MNERLNRLLPVLWALLLVAVTYVGIELSTGNLLQVLLGSAALAAASLVVVPASSGNRYSGALAVAIALPLMIGTYFDVGAVFATMALGFLAGWVVVQLIGSPGQIATADGDFVRQSVGAFLFTVVFLGLVGVTEMLTIFDSLPGAAALTAATVAAAIWFCFETVLWAVVSFDRFSQGYFVRLAVLDWPVAFSLFVVGALFAFALPALGWWAPVVALLPYSFAHLAFYRSHSARITYSQTIRSLARIPEVAGLSPDGHSDRTADLAVTVAADLGLNPHDVKQVEYAARLHDIGRITLNELNILKVGFTEDDIARWGAEIIGEAPYLNEVADLVRQQHAPYRRPGENKDPRPSRSVEDHQGCVSLRPCDQRTGFLEPRSARGTAPRCRL